MIRVQIVVVTLMAAVSLAIGASPARAEDDPNVADVRCLVVAIKMAGSPESQTRSVAMLAGLYFVGRLRGRAPDMDLEAAMVRQLRTMTTDDIERERLRCGAVLNGQASRLAVISGDLMNTEAPAAGPPPPSPDPKK